MNRVKKANNDTFQHLPVEKEKEYGLSDLNWQDDGGTINEYSLTDPSMKDYLKGYQMEPYEFKQYADKNVLHLVSKGETLASIAEKYYGHKSFAKEIVKLNSSLTSKPFREGLMLIVGREPNIKEAAKEVMDITYTPESIAKEILTIWSQVDGPLQDFFNGFTVNKMTNDMKKEVAEILNNWGYDITPVLVDETPKYAKKIAAYKSISKMATKKIPNDISGAFEYFKNVFPSSKLIQKVAEEVKQLEEEQNVKVSKEDAQGLLDYYKLIFPDEYASSLVNIVLDKPEIGFDEFKDIQLSDESLEQMEKMDSGNQKPLGNPNNGGLGGYDFTTQMRPDSPGGVVPNAYETRAKRVFERLKKKVVADAVDNIPLHMVMDAISVASKSVSYLLSRKLDVPPVPIKTVRKQDGGDIANSKEELPHNFKLPSNKVQVFEVWKVFLNDEEDVELDEAYVVLSADFIQEGYANGDWENVEYRGFYTTLEEAQNEINGYLR